MSDSIKDAQQLRDGATPAPWELSETEVTHRLLGGEAYEFGGEPLLVIGGGPEEATPIEHEDAEDRPPYFYLIQHYADGELMAAAPDLAQALAEETWEYGVTYIGVKHGGHHIEWAESTGDAEFDKDTLQRIVKRGKKWGQSPKIVRRRVSPPEVINE